MHYDRDTSEDRRYWTSRLGGRWPRTSLWPDLRWRGQRRWSEQAVAIRFPASLETRLQEITGGNDFLVHAALLGALQACLHRLTGSERIVVATPTRRPAESPNLLFASATVRGGLAFRQLLAQARQTLLEAHAHQGYPFGRLLGDLGLQADGERSPLTGILLCNDSIHLPAPEHPFDLALHFHRTPSGLAGTAGFDEATYRRGTVERLAVQLERALAAGLASPDVEVDALPLLTPEERRTLASHSASPPPAAAGWLHRQVAAQAVARADAAAVCWQAEILTYAELDRRARRLAARLAAMGVGRGCIVGVACERGFDRVVAPLAVLKAGGAFLPLDPEYPRERLGYMLADSGAAVVLVSTRVHAALADVVPGSCRIVDLADSSLVPAGGRRLDIPVGGRRLDVRVGGDDLAYVVYTSGSTGRPKGVQLTHRGLANLAGAQIRAFGVESRSSVLQLAAFSFDAAVSETAMALAAGALLDLGDATRMMPGPALAELLRERAVSHLTVTPSALRELPPVSLPGLRALIAAGEACGPELVSAWAPGRRFLNAYGPTEGTVCATLGECDAVECAAGDFPPPIGRPMAGARVHVLDGRLEPMPPGAPGELCIGGEGVARGYLGRPGLTAARFVPDPFSAAGGERLYRSGDLGRFLPDGRLEFLGRNDRQVKLRGSRIEPGEVESALMTHPEVHQAAVVVHERRAGQPRLVAFVVAAASAAPAPEQLRAWLRVRLPEFMMPAGFVALPALPLTPSGKIDRAALGDAAMAASVDDHEAIVAPRDVVELELSRIWEELLDRRPIGVRTSFFDVGGHSLLAMRLVTRIQQHFGAALPLVAIFEGATVEKMACRLREGRSRSWSPLVAVDPRGERSPLFCVHPAGGTVLCYRDLARHLGGQRPFYGLQARGLGAGEEPIATMEAVAAAYVQAIRDCQPHGPYHLAGWSFGGVAAFEMACQLRDAKEEVAFLALFDAYSPDVLAGSFHDRDDAEVLSALMGGLVAVTAESLRRLEPDAQLSHLIARARERELIPPDFDAAQATRLLRMSKTHYQVVESYRPRPFDGRVTLLRAEGERSFAASHTTDPTLGWARWAAGGVEVCFVPGTHQTMMLPPQVEGLAASLRSCLEQAEPAGSDPAALVAGAVPP